MPSPVLKPEAVARVEIDAALEAAGWEAQGRGDVNLHARRGVAVREFPLEAGHGFADYLLYVDGKACGVVEAKKVGVTLTGVEAQSDKYSEGMPQNLPAHTRPLPFLYQTTGIETRFTNLLDPEPRSRQVFTFHRPETLASWLARDLDVEIAAEHVELPTLRSRLRHMPPLDPKGLREVQFRAIESLEKSLAEDRPRALVQMATGSGKTFFAVSETYRLLKFGGAKRVLFLVDRGNLGRQALKEFQAFETPDDGRKFTSLYNVQHLTSNKLDPVAKVCIATIQRLYSMLQGKELAEEDEEVSLFETAPLAKEPLPVSYNPAIPIEFFDVVFTDECHRSIYNLWRQVLEYFDCFLVGLTATPSKQTFGFFNQNLVMEYGHAQAVADKVNVDFEVYRIRTEITEKGSKVEAGLFVDKRDRQTRQKRWDQLDEDLSYDPNELDRKVVAPDQIRTLIRTFKERLFTEIFPGREDVPKTLIFAKDDSHADDIVQIVREEFGKGNEFAKKITYRTTGEKPEDLIAEFRNSYNPRVVVTVDMIATGTDIKPVEIVMFMRAVRSRNLFEQMKGRGVRVINESDFRSVTTDAVTKDHFVIVDCVGVTDHPLEDSQPLEKKPRVALEKLLQTVALGGLDVDLVSTLASRLARIDRRLGKTQRADLEKLAGQSLTDLTRGMVEAIDPDRQIEAARMANALGPESMPSAEQLAKATEALLEQAVMPLKTSPAFRKRLIEVQAQNEQFIDTLSQDKVVESGYSADAKEKAKGLVASFEKYIEEHKDEITALQVLYSKRWASRLRYDDVKALAEKIEAPPRSWTRDRLWAAYVALDKSKVKGASGKKILTDVVSLVRFALHQENELVPFPDRVSANFANWMAQQENKGRKFTPAQREWLELIKDHVAASLKIEKDDFDDVPFNQKGGLGKVFQLFGNELDGLLEELNEVLVG